MKVVGFGQSYGFVVFISSIHQEITIIFGIYRFHNFFSSEASLGLPGGKRETTGHEAVQHKCNFVVSPLLNVQYPVFEYFGSYLRLNLPLCLQ